MSDYSIKVVVFQERQPIQSSPTYAIPFVNRELTQFGPPFVSLFIHIIYAEIGLKLCNNKKDYLLEAIVSSLLTYNMQKSISKHILLNSKNYRREAKYTESTSLFSFSS